MIYLLSPLPKEGTIHLPMIQFQTIVERIEFNRSDTLMFTSKQAVKCANEIDPTWKNYPSVAIGNATTKQIEALDGEVIYQPSSFYGKVLSQEIVSQLSAIKLLYLRPETVSFDAKTYLEKAGIIINEQCIYKTSCISYKQKNRPEKGAVIIFTSPSTIRCFLENFAWDQSYTAIVIGESTADHLIPSMRYAVADEPLIESCIEKAKSLSGENYF